MRLLFLLFPILFGLPYELLECVLIALDSLVVLEQNFKLIVLLLEKGKGFSILALEMLPELSRHQVLGMVPSFLVLLNHVFPHDHAKFFRLNPIWILINIWVVVLEVNSVDINV